MSTYVNGHGEFVQRELPNPYASIMTIDMERERERNLYEQEDDFRERWLRLRGWAR